jgi:pimeloyl-ACP methyl ester carboxylesterase
MYIAGKSDWGTYQTPGAADSMQNSACTQMVEFHLVEGAGHWVQQEQPKKTAELLLAFLRHSSQDAR